MMSSDKEHLNEKKLILYAPNVHLGGGLVLLMHVIDAVTHKIKSAHFDKRAQHKLKITPKCDCFYVHHSLKSRLYAEWRLWRSAKPGDVILCFHGLPPLFPRYTDVIVFIQNRLLFTSDASIVFPSCVRMRLFIEKCFIRLHRKNCTRYIVQTPSMATAVKKYLGDDIHVEVFPFASDFLTKGTTELSQIRGAKKTFDFIYIASGDAHKNHKNLLEAWRLLAEAGVRPSLALTVSSDMYPSISSEINYYISRYGLNIVNLGNVPWQNISALYRSSCALIFPSKSESFGLPLIEASQLGLPILAPELDYVRDIIHPEETFCPNSPLSMARAIRRFLGKAERIIPIRSPEEFLREILS